MKTDRLTLMIAPADKAAIAGRAAELRLPVSEFVRRATASYDPAEDAARAEIEALLPEFEGAIDRMLTAMDRMLAGLDEHQQRMAWLRSPEHREQVRREVEANPDIDWDWVAQLRAGVLHRQPEAA